MCWLDSLPPELAAKRKLLIFLYSFFFVVSPMTFWLQIVGFLYILSESVMYEHSYEIYTTFYFCTITNFLCFPAILIYNIIEDFMLFGFKTYNTCSTIAFRSMIGIYDLFFIITTTIDFVYGDGPLFMCLLYISTLITNLSLLLIIVRIPRKEPCFSPT